MNNLNIWNAIIINGAIAARLVYNAVKE